MTPHPADITDDQWERLSGIEQELPDVPSGEVEQQYLWYCDYYRQQTKDGTHPTVIHKAAFVRTKQTLSAEKLNQYASL